MRDPPSPETLLMTVGGSPLPLLLSIATLTPRNVQLVCTAGSRYHAQLLQQGVQELMNADSPRFLEPIFVDAGNPQDVYETIVQAAPQEPFDLDYTGGTKAMSVGAYHAWCHRRSNQTNAWHSSERSGTLRSDNGHEYALGPAAFGNVGLDLLAQLYGNLAANGTLTRGAGNGRVACTPQGIAELLAARAPTLDAYHAIALTSPARRNISLDVVAIRGGRPFVLTVINGQDIPAAGAPRFLKLKLFATVRHATQLGGVGARAALVAEIDEARRATLTREVVEVMPAALAPRHVMAFGTVQLRDAQNGDGELIQWFNP